ncbi:MAG: vacuolar sorting-associated 35B-like [Trebouxia sp. A1-2]|nr:MAG: vacuolar sorting-associated 35B-like [Trebouxia sp. A1-2]
MSVMGDHGGLVTSDQEQQKWLDEASTSVKRNAFFMKKALDEDNLREALRYSAAMLGELRTSQLTPQKYFELYMQTFTELQHLEMFFKEEHKKGRQYSDLYELVQHAGYVLPRMYLLCTVGSCYIRSKETAAKDILKDLVELCKGVQHPTRGLFLRSYLCQVSRGLLPDVGSEYEGAGGDITDAVDFLLVNFTEMNKLWVRMQHQGSNRDKDRRERERQQLADLVGRNLTYASQLDGLDYKLYQGVVLPRVMEQIIQCKDNIAQQYLMQCVIQGFPDEFHVSTLDVLLGALPELQGSVKVHVILASMLDRLASYATTDESVLETYSQADAFSKLSAAATKVAQQQSEMPAGDIASMYIALLGFTGKVYPDKLDYTDKVYSCLAAHLAKKAIALQRRELSSDPRAEKQVVALLSIPLDTYDAVTVLGLHNYPSVMSLLSPPTYKQMAVTIVQSMLKAGTLVGSEAKVGMLFDFISPLVKDVPGALDHTDDEDFAEEQNLVARMVHQLRSDDPDEHFPDPEDCQTALQHRRTTACQAHPAHFWLSPPLQVLQFVHGIVAPLADVPVAELALQIYLQAAYSASEAFILYEEAIPDSKAEITALQSIVGTLHKCRVFSPENRDVLVHKATGYSAKLLKKADQCRAVCTCSHLFWQEEPLVRDADNVLSCLKRALKIANAAQQQLAVALKASDTSPAFLYVEILNQYLYYFEQGLPNITASVIQSLLELVANEISSDSCKQDERLQKFYSNSMEHLKVQKDREGDLGERYEALKL